jgi:hypothetical protein
MTGAVGVLTSNKYQTQDASRQRNDAKKRQEEIKKASAIIVLLEKKYVENINRLVGNITISKNNHSYTISDNDEKILIDLYKAGKKSEALVHYKSISGLKLAESMDELEKLMISKGVKNESTDVVEPTWAQKSPGLFFIIAVIVIILVFKLIAH